MPKLLSSREIVKVLEKNGFTQVSQKGSHIKFFSVIKRRVVIVPANKRIIPIGTFHSILRQSKLSKIDFGL